MTPTPGAPLAGRLLILAPIGKDAALIEGILREVDVACTPCRSVGELTRELARGAAALLLTEEVFADDDGRLAAAIATQPPWSDLPVLFLTRSGADSQAAAHAVETLGNTTLLERPVRVAALTSAVRSALRARDRQYQTRAHLAEREDANQRKDQFLATLAHELRNPLAPIRNSLHLLRLAGTDAISGPAGAIMERQLNHLVRLVDDLMEVSRITLGKIELRRSVVSLAAVIAAAVETSRPLIDAARHDLRVTLPPEDLTVDVDAMRLAQVFSNLLNNAARYSDPGGRISITTRREDDTAVIVVADSGIGIPAHALTSVFDMFAQADTRDSRGGTGLGIGLTLARRLVELHDGTVTAASAGAGQGSEFAVRLPMANRLETAPAVPADPTEKIRAPHRILVVDDNHDAADTLGALLELIGAEVNVAYDGQGALDAIATFLPNVVILDLGMPGMDGYEVASRIREHPRGRRTTLIALTGWGQEKDRRHTAEAGFAHHLTKPVGLDDLQAVLASLPRSTEPIEAGDLSAVTGRTASARG